MELFLQAVHDFVMTDMGLMKIAVAHKGLAQKAYCKFMLFNQQMELDISTLSPGT